jgi:hypothetical protein
MGWGWAAAWGGRGLESGGGGLLGGRGGSRQQEARRGALPLAPPRCSPVTAPRPRPPPTPPTPPNQQIGKQGEASHGAATDFDMTEKDITPMGGFPHYGVIKEDYLMLKVGGDGCLGGWGGAGGGGRGRGGLGRI